MKKNYIVLFMILACLIPSAQAQFQLGIKGGLNFATISGATSGFDVKNNTGWHAGLMAEVKLPVIGVEGDVLYSRKGFKVKEPNTGLSIATNLTYIDIPIVAKFYIAKVFNLQLGPQFSINTSAKALGVDISNTIKSSDVSGVLGLGFELSKLSLSARYTLGFTDINDPSGTDSNKNNVFQLSAGIWLKK